MQQIAVQRHEKYSWSGGKLRCLQVLATGEGTDASREMTFCASVWGLDGQTDLGRNSQNQHGDVVWTTAFERHRH